MQLFDQRSGQNYIANKGRLNDKDLSVSHTAGKYSALTLQGFKTRGEFLPAWNKNQRNLTSIK